MMQAQNTEKAAPRPYERKVKNYLIDRSFQLRWVGAVIVLTVLLLSALGGYIVYAEQHASEAIIQGLQKFYEPEAAAEVAEMFEVEDNAIMWGLLATGLGLVFSLAGIGILVTHKVAGPMVGLKFSLDSAAQGHYGRIRGFRQGDAFPTVSQSLLEMGQSLRAREEHEIRRLEALLQADELPGTAAAAVRKLIDEKRSRLG